jgi:DNA-binding transcriptional LysR family regulator
LPVQIDAANQYQSLIEAEVDIAICPKEHEGDSGITIRRLAEHSTSAGGVDLSSDPNR